ncbi:hypothetical protein AeMF1_008172, partial [Aphanomyces euteiches]
MQLDEVVSLPPSPANDRQINSILAELEQYNSITLALQADDVTM